MPYFMYKATGTKDEHASLLVFSSGSYHYVVNGNFLLTEVIENDPKLLYWAGNKQVPASPDKAQLVCEVKLDREDYRYGSEVRLESVFRKFREEENIIYKNERYFHAIL